MRRCSLKVPRCLIPLRWRFPKFSGSKYGCGPLLTPPWSGRWPADWGFGPSPEDLQSAIVSCCKQKPQTYCPNINLCNMNSERFGCRNSLKVPRCLIPLRWRFPKFSGSKYGCGPLLTPPWSGRWPADWGFGPSPEDLQSAIVSCCKQKTTNLLS